MDDLFSSVVSAISRGNKDVAQTVTSRIQSGVIDLKDLENLLKTAPSTGSLVLPRSSKYKPAVLTQPGAAPTTFNGKTLTEITSPNGAPVTKKFYTEQGSEYVLTADGATQRIKSVHANTGGSDIGLHDWNQKAFFTLGDEGKAFNTAGAMMAQKGIPFTITAQEGKLQYLLYDGRQWRPAKISDVYPKAVQQGTPDTIIAATYSKNPLIGSHILEVNTKDRLVSRIHPGSEVSYIEKPDWRGQVLKPEQISENMFNFKDNWYFGHATDPNLLQEIQNTGLRNSIHDTAINQFYIGNWEQYQNYLEKARLGTGLHHGSQGFSVIEIPKTSDQTKIPKDLYDYLTPEELVNNIKEGSTPSRYSFLAVDAR